jgi:hypothetical protein
MVLSFMVSEARVLAFHISVACLAVSAISLLLIGELSQLVYVDENGLLAGMAPLHSLAPMQQTPLRTGPWT